MDSERWQKAVSLFHAALELGAEERAAMLNRECGDEELRREVISLLAQDTSRHGILERVSALATGLEMPDFIGCFKILEIIGEGGMGVVYRAQQDHPRRSVALKVIRPGLATGEVLRRFEQEADALGRLHHAGIAQIYEAGVSRGQPYYAMELIDGLALIEYARVNQLSTLQKVEVAVKLCEAAHHAHQRGIVHRDLKPSNILVDETGQPKILDFGVALLGGAEGGMTQATSMGTLVGTLAYMSPEQVSADAGPVDARSDVYSLGLVIYELLSGRLPYVTGGAVPGAMRVIQEQEPLGLGRVKREFRGDLETITAKALEKDRERRYESAEELAADLRRHLADQPILARPASALYQASKFAQRNKAIAFGLAAVFLVLAGGVVVSTWQAARARRAEQVSEAVRNFLEKDVLAQAGPNAQAAPTGKADTQLTVRTALDRAAGKVDGKFNAQPEVEASIRNTIGNAYVDLGLYGQAQPMLERALALRERELGLEHVETQATMQSLGILYRRSGKLASAEATILRLLEIRKRVKGSTNADTIATQSEVASILTARGNHKMAAALLSEGLEGQRSLVGEEHPDTLAMMNNLGTTYANLGQYFKAAAILGKAIEIKQRVFGQEHPTTLMSMNGLAMILRNQGKYAEAEALLSKALRIRRQTLGMEHPDTLASLNSLALLYFAQGRYAEAEPLLKQAAETGQRLRPESADTLRMRSNLAELYWKLGKTEAEPILRNVIEVRRRVLGEKHPNTANGLALLGEMKMDEKQYGEAEMLLRQALSIQETEAPNEWKRFYNQGLLGEVLNRVGQRTEAKVLLQSAVEGLLQRQETIPHEKEPAIEAIKRWNSKFQ